MSMRAEIMGAAETPEGLGLLLGDERARLVRLCARITGDAEAAEDLAQETLFEAWRRLAKLRDADGLSPWLAAIARNVCLRWMRQRGRELGRRLTSLDGEDAGNGEMPLRETIAVAASDDDDPLRALERDELAALLERALALLPAQTRDALVASYVDERPASEIAARLGLSEVALRVRLHRGRQALRGVLEGELLPEAAAFGIAAPAADGWRDTRIVCPFCGRHHVQILARADHDLAYRCAGLCMPGGIITGGIEAQTRFARSLKSPKSILTHNLLWLHDHYQGALKRGDMTCLACGAPMPLRRGTDERFAAAIPAEAPLAEVFRHGIQMVCPRCGDDDGATLWHLALDMPEAQRFWQRHPRMRALAPREVETAGVPALVTGFASVDGCDRLNVVIARDTLAVLGVHGALE